MTRLKVGVGLFCAVAAIAWLVGGTGSKPAQAAGSAPVTVINTPLPVTMRPAMVPYTVTVFCGAEGKWDCMSFFTVPEGKRFVIEYVSAQGKIKPAGQNIPAELLQISTWDAALADTMESQRYYYLQLTFGGTHTDGDSYFVSEKVLMFAEPSTTTNLIAWAVPSDDYWIRVNLTGYLQPLN